MASCSAVALMVLCCVLPAIPLQGQQTSSGNSNDAPGWPVTNPVPGHGRMIPDPTTGMENPNNERSSESCSVWFLHAGERATVSAATLQVPDKARSEYDKACADLQHKKLSGAEDHLHQAVQQYPRYPAAWVLLGQVLGMDNKITEAANACSQATAVDSGYAPAYLCLADVADDQKQWNQALEMADRALALSSGQSAYAQYYTAIAQFHLGQLTAARESALQTIDADRFHQLPQAHILLAQIYAQDHQISNAEAQLRAYLKIAPDSPDSAAVRKKLLELEAQNSK